MQTSVSTVEAKFKKYDNKFFMGTYLDIGSLKSVVGLQAAYFYSQSASIVFKTRKALLSFEIGNHVFPCLGSRELRMGTPDGGLMPSFVYIIESDIMFFIAFSLRILQNVVLMTLLTGFSPKFMDWKFLWTVSEEICSSPEMQKNQVSISRASKSTQVFILFFIQQAVQSFQACIIIGLPSSRTESDQKIFQKVVVPARIGHISHTHFCSNRGRKWCPCLMWRWIWCL